MRLVEYAIAIRDGVPMGRWWPDPVFGRGYPFLCLYAPLLYLVATPFMLLGVSGLAIIKIVSALLVVAGIAGTYGVARRRASRPAALAAVVLFVYAPYLQTDLWIRADIAESLGFACFPLTLFALDVALDGAGDAAASTPPRWRWRSPRSARATTSPPTSPSTSSSPGWPRAWRSAPSARGAAPRDRSAARSASS